jgi:hypothetical protein
MKINKAKVQEHRLTADEFYNQFCDKKEGVLSSYPIDETAMRYFGITREDVEKYIKNKDKRAGIVILREILIAKGILEE